MQYEPIIGLEIHVQLKTKSKMFCGCDNTGENQPPNTTICPICLGHPGTLPVINKQAVDWSVMAALAINCQIPQISKFDRKNYFYPDLPKGYQISQFDLPIGLEGFLEIEIDGQLKKIGLRRLHLEEDAAKLIHGKNESLVDFNRSGTPLMEIVTKPDIRSPREAKIFLRELRKITRYLEVSEADMEKGHLRCDANISLRPLEVDDEFYPKTEIKNINSFRAVERALEYEFQRQTRLWDEKNPPRQQSTRGWNDDKQITEEQRLKEESADYRYFPEPDLPPLRFEADSIQLISTSLPELPAAKKKRFIEMYGFTADDAQILTDEKELAHFTEQVISELKEWLSTLEKSEKLDQEKVWPRRQRRGWQKNKKELVKLTAGWLISKLFKLLNENNLSIKQSKVTPENFAELISIIYQGKINSTVAQQVLEEMFAKGSDPSQIIEEKGLEQVSDESQLEKIVNHVIANNPDELAKYKAGKTALFQFFVGQVMKETKGKANPEVVAKLLKKKLI
ncbi:MAG TPA: Asp-tRNA(Asn)/Glu-tRNA(Gln) amidotransferase subunit GatB [Patescibacteria group bacterium]